MLLEFQRDSYFQSQYYTEHLTMIDSFLDSFLISLKVIIDNCL